MEDDGSSAHMRDDGTVKTVKPKKVLTEKQLETLKLGREKWMEKRRELKSQKMLTIDPQKKKYDEDKARVEAEINKIRKEIEDKLRSDYDNKLSAIKEEYESAQAKFSAEKAKEIAKEEIKAKYTKKPKKIIEVYSTEQETDTDEKPKFPIASKRSEKKTVTQADNDINKFFF
jgi:hypothetical protein